MKLTIEINMDGAAFEEEAGIECERILCCEVVKPLHNTDTAIMRMAARDRISYNLRDINGNVCGSVTVEE